jgi:hypothetical protein
MRDTAFTEILRKIPLVLLVQGRLVHEGCRPAAFTEMLRKILIVLLVHGRLVHEGYSLYRNFEKIYYSIIGSETARP